LILVVGEGWAIILEVRVYKAEFTHLLEVNSGTFMTRVIFNELGVFNVKSER